MPYKTLFVPLVAALRLGATALSLFYSFWVLAKMTLGFFRTLAAILGGQTNCLSVTNSSRSIEHIEGTAAAAA